MSASDDGGEGVELRELAPEELDVPSMVQHMFFRVGAAWTAVRDERLASMLFELMPFLKALGQLALEEPERAQRYWADALRRRMPFGVAPLGMPRAAKEKAP